MALLDVKTGTYTPYAPGVPSDGIYFGRKIEVRTVKRLVPFLLLASTILAAGSPDIRPRADVAEYPAHAGFDAAEIGVAVIPAASAGKQPRPRSETDSSEVSVNAGASIQRESYPDPVTGRRVGTPTIGANSGVGVGTPGEGQRFPAPSASNRDQPEQKLWEKSLPDGKTSVAVAGYLCFPKPSKKSKNDSRVLRWENAEGNVKIVIPNPGK